MTKKPKTSFIEINGRRYNTATGQVIDGFIGKPQKIALSSKKPAHTKAAPSHTVHGKRQPSHTLMRKAVKKPSLITSGRTVVMDLVPARPMQAKTTFHAASNERIARAKAVKQNALIKRFSDNLVGRPTSPVVDNIEAKLDNLFEHHQPIYQPKLVHKQQPADKLLEKGMRAANSHNQKLASKAKLHHRIGNKLGLGKKASSVMSASLAVLILGAFFAYQYKPNIEMHYAAARAGVNATLPGYKPAGYALNSKIDYSSGKLSLSYHANADGRGYILSQQNSNWDSQSLKSHLSSDQNLSLQTYPVAGRTIFFHDGGADWVDKGIWYSISGNASLNTDQIIKIANSI